MYRESSTPRVHESDVAAVQAPDEVDAKLKEKISAKMDFTLEEIAEMDAPAAAGIGPDEKAALRYAEALTLNPGDIPADVFSGLEEHFSDSQIVEITMVAALYNMVNRFNKALKLDLEEY